MFNDRSLPVFAMASAPGVRLRLASTACTRGMAPFLDFLETAEPNYDYHSGAATTASRLGQPDLAIATLNDFVQAGSMVASIDPTCPVIADADTG